MYVALPIDRTRLYNITLFLRNQVESYLLLSAQSFTDVLLMSVLLSLALIIIVCSGVCACKLSAAYFPACSVSEL